MANKIYKGKPTKDGRCYYFRKSKNNKQYTSKKYLTHEECETALSLFILKNETPINIKFELVSLDFFNDLYKIRKESTVEGYKLTYIKHIKPYFERKYINKIKLNDIKIWAETLQKLDLKTNTLNRIYNILKLIFDYAIKNYNLRDNPVQLYGRFKQKQDRIISDKDKLRYITFEDYKKFIAVVDDELRHAFFTTAYYTGCRKGELLALTWNDIDFENNEIQINKTLFTKIKGKVLLTSTKNNKNRIIKMSNTLKNELFNYYNTQIKYKDFKNSWFVFGSTNYLPLTTIDRYKHHYFELSGVKEITMHEFRHSHVSLLINEYIKSGQTDTTKFFLMMSDRMGHSIDVMQRTYMHLFPTVQDEIVDLLNNL